MKLIYLKQNSKRGNGEFYIHYKYKQYPAPKSLQSIDIFKMNISSKSGYAICREIDIEPTLGILNYISKIETKILKDQYKFLLEREKEVTKNLKIKCILNKYVGIKVYIFDVISSFHYDYDFKIYSNKILSIAELKEKFKQLGEAQYQVREGELSVDSIKNGYFFLDRYKIDLIDKPY